MNTIVTFTAEIVVDSDSLHKLQTLAKCYKMSRTEADATICFDSFQEVFEANLEANGCTELLLAAIEHFSKM